MNFRDFWYIAAEAKELRPNRVMGVRILGEWLALFRDGNGQAVALEDRCLHRCAQLSKGAVRQGQLQCLYHGWTYDGSGQVVCVPSEGPQQRSHHRRARGFQVCEQDDYVYLRLADSVDQARRPFKLPFYRAGGWGAIRLKNRFQNNVANCAENFVDIPHTAFVHPNIFRVSRHERIAARVERKDGTVRVDYRNERTNLGIFSRFLNPDGHEIEHTDWFHMPNVTSVDYRFSQDRRFIITSQSIPVTEEETLVYTDLTYNYGWWNAVSRPIIRWQAQKIIDQDIEILGNQQGTVRQYGPQFANTEADLIHVMIESIHHELSRGNDPRQLPEQTHEIEFWV